MGVGPSVKRARSSQLPKELLKELSKERQQVAAVCYRVAKRGIEFLLVQTRGGRWIFPKGGVESGLTQAQSAALEAIEEAGVHGRMEEIPFARYFRCQGDTTQSSEPRLAVAAHLCEVTRLEPPQEANRNPSWFSAEKAKQRLLKGRALAFGAELARVVDRALLRIQRVHRTTRSIPHEMYRDSLQKVRFEAFEGGRFPFQYDLREAALARLFLRPRRAARTAAAIEAEAGFLSPKIPQIGAAGEIRRPVLRLGAGTNASAEITQKVTRIDRVRTPGLSKTGKVARSRTDRSSN